MSTQHPQPREGNGETTNRWLENHQALAEMSVAHFGRMARLPWLALQAQRVKKGATPSSVIYEDGRVKLLHYRRNEPAKFRTPLVIVFAMVNRPYIIDLLPHKSVVSHFLRAGFEIYLVDWGAPSHADRNNTLDDYINGYLHRIVNFVRRRTGSRQVNVLGYCMGGTMSAIYTAMHPKRVKNLMLMAAGIDFSAREHLIGLWADERNFDADAFVDAFGNCPATFLQSMFLMLKPVGNLIEKPLRLYERIDDEPFVDEYLTMETWLNDNIPLPGEVFRQFVKDLYQRNQLVQGQLMMGGRRVDLKKIICPVLNLMATQDDLVPPSQSRPLNDLVGSSDRTLMEIQAGHIGLAVGSKAQKELWPKAREWLAARSEPA
jgi:polyhydroxyalkanoate synthase subunit PhaC